MTMFIELGFVIVVANLILGKSPNLGWDQSQLYF